MLTASISVVPKKQWERRQARSGQARRDPETPGSHQFRQQREAAAVMPARAMRDDRGAVFRCGIALVHFPTEMGCFLVQIGHQRIPVRFRQHRCGGDAPVFPVAL